MKHYLSISLVCAGLAASAADITTLDGKKYEDVRNIAPKRNGLYFIVGSGMDAKGVSVLYTNLPDAIREQYHYDAFAPGLAIARENAVLNMNKNLAFSLANLEAAKKKAKAEGKLLGFIMEWDNMFVPAHPWNKGGNCGLAHFYLVFHEPLVLVFVRHEGELDSVPAAVNQGFKGPDEGGWAPNMAVVTADCSQFVCEIPYGGENSTGPIRDQIFRQKIAVIKEFQKQQAAAKPASTGSP
jgi:hypothetical protein